MRTGWKHSMQFHGVATKRRSSAFAARCVGWWRHFENRRQKSRGILASSS